MPLTPGSTPWGGHVPRHSPPPQGFRQLLLSLLVAAAVVEDVVVVRAAPFNVTTGLCNVYTFVPFTDSGDSGGARYENATANPAGFLHMASALLAMEHFNARDTSVVPELASLLEKCPAVKFDVNASLFFDSGGPDPHAASRALFRAGTSPPCAVAGPYNSDGTANRDLAVMAQAATFPIVLSRNHYLETVQTAASPYTSCVYPDVVVTAQRLAEFLISKGRGDYISVFYPKSTFGLQWKDVLELVLESYGVETFLQVMINRLHNLEDADESSSQHGGEEEDNTDAVVLRNLRAVKDRGFRTIVVPLEDPLRALPMIARAAERLQMSDGKYFWIWLGDVSSHRLRSAAVSTTRLLTPEVRKLVYGSAWITAVETMCLRDDDEENDNTGSNGRQNGTSSDPFHRALTSQGSAFVERVMAMNPVPSGELGYVDAGPTYFEDRKNQRLELGAGFVYDAVMSIGIGACQFYSAATTLSGGDMAYAAAADEAAGFGLLQGIQEANFTGATGTVRFRDRPTALGSRSSDTAYFGTINLLPTEEDSGEESVSSHHFSDFYCPEIGKWEQRANFTYADGRQVPPDLLRDEPPQNYLPSGLRIFGYVMLGIVLLLALASSAWVHYRRSNRVVRAAQPVFLQQLILGSGVFALAIIPLSLDDASGMSPSQLNSCCMAVPWLVSAGHMLSYCAMFAKLWRVNKVLQFTRRKITVTQVLWPVAALFGAAVLVLGLWTGLDPLVWTREVLDPYTGATVGYCQSNDLWAFAAPLAVLMFIPTVLTGIMAWKTKDVDAAYSDSAWIFTLIMLQAELYLVAVPVIAILRTASNSGFYVGFVLFLAIFPLSTLLLIIAPKVYAYRQDVTGQSSGSNAKRGARQGVRISGLNDSHATTSNVQRAVSSEERGSTTVLHENEERQHKHQTIHTVEEIDRESSVPKPLESQSNEQKGSSH